MSFNFSSFVGDYYLGSLYRQSSNPYYLGNVYGQGSVLNSAVSNALSTAVNNALNDVAEKAGYTSFESALAASLKEQGFQSEKILEKQADVMSEKGIQESMQERVGKLRQHHL